MNINNVSELGLKELFSLRSDPVLVLLIGLHGTHQDPSRLKAR